MTYELCNGRCAARNDDLVTAIDLRRMSDVKYGRRRGVAWMDDLVIDLHRLSYVTVEARRAMMVSRSICVVTVEVRRVASRQMQQSAKTRAWNAEKLVKNR